eukprot:GHVU01111347.1.p2 GENE.GHVU01111347.1~~GHVU01111347.1.p2  ORF type:complete len:126 (+),score=2.61 GHVU01111347.1:397-774(+)
MQMAGAGGRAGGRVRHVFICGHALAEMGLPPLRLSELRSAHEQTDTRGHRAAAAFRLSRLSLPPGSSFAEKSGPKGNPIETRGDVFDTAFRPDASMMTRLQPITHAAQLATKTAAQPTRATNHKS